MKFSTAKELFSARTLLIGLIFFSVNATFSYMFYHINSHKIFVMLIGVTLLFILSDLIFFNRPAPNEMPPKKLLKILAIISAPLLATFPGYLIHQGAFNYNFEYELATHLILILWALYICKSASSKTDVSALLLCMGLTIIYVAIWAIFEKVGHNPFAPEYNPSTAGTVALRVKSTFGNINYFAGFLNVVLPLYVAFSLPGIAPSTAPATGFFSQARRLQFKTGGLFCLSVLLFGAISLFLTKTRAAMAGSLVGVSFTVCVLGGMSLSKSALKKIALALAGLLILLILFIGVSAMTHPDLIFNTRFGELLKIEAWYGRLLPWKVAWESITTSPATGYGLGSSYNLFFEFLDPFAKLYAEEQSYNHAHSEILEYAQEAGIIGLLANSFFWGYIFSQLIKIARNPASGEQRRMAIGIAGGLLAYLVHSSFSVAPRMMVTKLPVYTLFGLTFVMDRLHHGHDKETAPFSMAWRWPLIGFSVFALIISWSLYLPWALRQKSYVDQMSWGKPTHEMMETIESSARKNQKNDVYFLENLMLKQLKMGRFTQMKETLGKIDELIPHYRDIDYYKAVGVLADPGSSHKLDEALAVVMEKRIRDRYHTGSMKLMVMLSVQLSHKEAFFQALGDLAIKSLFVSRLIAFNELDRIKIERKNMKEPILIYAGDHGGLNVQIANGAMNFWMKVAQKNLFKPISDSEKQQFAVFTLNDFLASRYFKLPVHPEHIAEKEGLEKIARQYNQMYISHFRLSDPAILAGAAQKENPSIQDEIKKRGMEKQIEILKEKTDWGLYSRKLHFISLFLKSFHGAALTGY